MNLPRKLLLAAVSAAALACATPASAQWAWRDASGKMVFSDAPPPRSVAARDIVRQPAAPTASRPRIPAEPVAEAAAEAKATPARPAVPTLAEREIESRRRQQLLAEAEKKAADEDAQRVRSTENCERLRAYQRALEGGFRVARVNAAGEQEILGDAQRAAEVERTRAQIGEQCR